MISQWIRLADIPASGREFSFVDDKVWNEFFEQFNLDCKLEQGLEAQVTLNPQPGGVLIQGQLKGRVLLPCARCTENSLAEINHQIQLFAVFDAEEQEEFLRQEGGSWELDLVGMLWEQFALSLPAKHLCSEKCAGICPQCGTNLNKQSCNCAGTTGDLRLAALRGLKIPKKQ